MFQKTAVFSRGIWTIPALRAFLPETAQLHFSPLAQLAGADLLGGCDSVVGWGKKPTAERARAFAKSSDIPYIALEDGFLRSRDLGVSGAQPLGIIVDPVGIYYDASAPSKLENLLNDTRWMTPALEARAKRGMALLKEKKLSKYNCFQATSSLESKPDAAPYVLVVDQTRGDVSVSLGGATEQTFEDMLQCALREHPDARIRIRQHPDVTAGKRQGYLSAVDYSQWPDAARIDVASDNANPWDAIAGAVAVYVVTSQLGMEAIFAGKSVRCFGLPCYAGWGLTGDEQQIARRKNRLSRETLFAAAYLKYTRYIDPCTEQLTTFEATAQLISDQQRHYQRLPEHIHYHGFSLWKRSFLSDFSGAGKQTQFSYRWQAARQQARLAESPTAHMSTWCEWASGQDVQRTLAQQPQETVYQRHFIEDGFLRSVGLGSDLARPCSLVFDKRGMYYDARQPSDLECLLLNHKQWMTTQDGERAKAVVKRITAHALSKYNASSTELSVPRAMADKFVILVTGQVEGDASLRYGGAMFASNDALLRHVRQANPDAFLIYKPHPDVESGNRQGHISEDCRRHCCDWYAADVSLPAVLELCDALHTATSLTGFEALLRGKQVVTYGMPFYAGWGLTQDHVKCERRSINVNLDTLVAAALVYYPVYVHPETRQVCSVEHIIDWLVAHRTQTHIPPLKTRIIRTIKQVVNS